MPQGTHYGPSTCASAASAWGSQNVMSMARYSAIAVVSSARACSSRPVLRIQAAQAEVAVGQERTHAQLLSQSDGLAVVVFGWLDLWGITMRGDVAQEAQGVRLVAAFLLGVRARSRARPARSPASSRRPASRYPSLSAATRSDWSCHKLSGLLHACSSSGRASAMRPSRAYARPRGEASAGKIEWPGPRLVDAEATLERGDGLVQVAFAQIQQADGQDTPREDRMGDQPPRQSVPLQSPWATPSANTPNSAWHWTRTAREPTEGRPGPQWLW